MKKRKGNGEELYASAVGAATWPMGAPMQSIRSDPCVAIPKLTSHLDQNLLVNGHENSSKVLL
jgi:hypothetical protein